MWWLLSVVIRQGKLVEYWFRKQGSVQNGVSGGVSGSVYNGVSGGVGGSAYYGFCGGFWGGGGISQQNIVRIRNPKYPNCPKD